MSTPAAPDRSIGIGGRRTFVAAAAVLAVLLIGGGLWWHGRVPFLPGPAGHGPVSYDGDPSIDFGIATSLVPGQFLTSPAALALKNDGSAPATILAVLPHQGRSPAPSIIKYVVVRVPSDTPVPINTRPPGVDAIGYRIMPGGSKHAVIFDVTSGPTKLGITWMQGIDVRYRYRGHDYTTYVPSITTYCGPDLKLYCPADGWKRGFTPPTASGTHTASD